MMDSENLPIKCMALDLIPSTSKMGAGRKSPEESFSGAKFLLHSVRPIFTYM